MARPNNRIQGSQTLTPKAGTTGRTLHFPGRRAASSRYTPRHAKPDGVLNPDYRQKGISSSLEQTSRPAGLPTPGISPMNRLRQSENSPVKDPLNYTNAGGKPTQNGPARKLGKQNPLQRMGKFLNKHKKASIVAASGGLIGGTMAIFSGLMTGPMAIIHAGEYVGSLADPIHDSIQLARTLKRLAKAPAVAKAMDNLGSAVRNSRVGSAGKLMNRGFTKTLEKAGMEVVTDSGGKMIGLAFKAGAGAPSARNLEKLKKAGKFADLVTEDGRTVLKFAENAKFADKIKYLNSALKTATKARAGAAVMSLINRSERLGSIVSRIGGVINRLQDFHPIKALTAKIKSAASAAASSAKRMLLEFMKRKAAAMASRLEGTAAKKVAGKIAEKVAEKAAAAIAKAAAAKAIIKGAFNAIKLIPGIGTAVGFLLNFGWEMIMRRAFDTSLNTNLNIAAGLAMEIQSTASQAMSGDFPTETEPVNPDDLADGEEVEPGEPMQELGLFHEAKLASQIEIINAPDENSPCYAIYAEMPEEPDEDEPEDSDVRVKYEEEKNAVLDRVQTCLDDQGEGDSIIETQESLFFNAAMVKHMDGNPSFQSHESLKDGVVPTELIAETYDDGGAKLIWDIFNSAVAALIIVSPDMFMEDDDHILNTLSANPEQTGSIATAGGKVLSNTKMLAVGGHSFEEGSGEAQELEMARRQYVQDEFNAKPFLARLFDVSDYRSAIVTLAHNSGWDTSDSSIGTQLKNVAKTFAALPSLITSSLNKMSYASAATSSSDFFGFGMVGYTEDQLNALPDYDVAADGIIKYHSEITTGNLKYSGIKEITSDGRITYQEDTNADNLDVSAAEAKPLGSDTAHGITLCDDFDVVAAGYVWADEDPDGSIAASCWSGEMIYAEKETTKDGEPVLDEDGDPVMEDTSVVIAGPTAYTTDQIVRTYLLDYPSIMAAAADDYRELCDDIEDAKDKSACETEKAEASDYIGEAMQDMGVMTGSESANTTNSEFNADTIQDDFQKTGCSSVGARQCTAVPHWFVDEYTSLTYGNGNGGQVSAFLATANNISTSSTPVAPAVFSGYTYNTSAICYPTSAPYGGKCGHTGLVIKVEGDVVTTLETWKGKAGQSPCSYIGTYKMSDHPDIQYVNLGEYLNEGA